MLSELGMALREKGRLEVTSFMKADLLKASTLTIQP